MTNRINEYFPTDDSCSGGKLEDIGDYAGGTKSLEAIVLVGAFNYLTTDEMIKHIRSLPWRKPDNVRIFVQEQDADRFEAVT